MRRPNPKVSKKQIKALFWVLQEALDFHMARDLTDEDTVREWKDLNRILRLIEAAGHDRAVDLRTVMNRIRPAGV
ncbi:hypothetical protein [Methylobacterium sp. WL120]|uniref:hypothetical protein n=1 Tax=Methylobacterium sp. WL120 TaxID=2603887 RepID=UPI0011C785F3|nr:hypothetical protein [Methylobacterium sp. WL120]TXM69645.1 hypothetical protein FV229_04690 [Methylobacterium sp. WL120]